MALDVETLHFAFFNPSPPFESGVLEMRALLRKITLGLNFTKFKN